MLVKRCRRARNGKTRVLRGEAGDPEYDKYKTISNGMRRREKKVGKNSEGGWSGGWEEKGNWNRRFREA